MDADADADPTSPVDDRKQDDDGGDDGGEEDEAPHNSAEDITTHAVRWDQMFRRLQEFKEKHGHCRVPNRYKEDPSLGGWVSAQRPQYKLVISGQSGSTALTTERAKKLMDIGFEWATTNPKNVTWETRYEQLKEFAAKYGHTQVPMRWQENEALSNWVSKQRQDYKLFQSGQSTRLNPERLNLLNKIGFVWEVDRTTSRQLKVAVLKTDESPQEEVAAFTIAHVNNPGIEEKQSAVARQKAWYDVQGSSSDASMDAKLAARGQSSPTTTATTTATTRESSGAEDSRPSPPSSRTGRAVASATSVQEQSDTKRPTTSHTLTSLRRLPSAKGDVVKKRKSSNKSESEHSSSKRSKG